MEKIFAVIMFVCLFGAANCHSQEVVFERFELKWFSIMGVRSDELQSLNLTLKNKSDKPIKYITVYYNAMNEVGDFVKTDLSVNCTGPFLVNKKYKLYVKGALVFPKLLKAVPTKIEIEFMDEEEIDIDITTENMRLYFPKIK